MDKTIELFVRREKLKEYIKKYPAVSLLVLVNTILFIIMSFDGGTTNPDTLLKYGALSKQHIMDGEFYRIITPMFLHIGYVHFLLNMASLVIFTVDIERMFGSVKYLVIYFISGICGGILTYLFSDASLTAGASGAIYGMLGVYLYMAFSKKHNITKESKKLILTMTGINVVTTLLIPFVSITGHFGGMFAGFLVSMVILKESKYRI